jgi:hypothetical protein
MMRQLAQLWAGSLALWMVLASGGWLVAGTTGVIDTAVACGLCLVPMTLTMLWCHHAFRGAAEQQLMAVLGGTGVRLLVVIAGGIALYHSVAELHRPAFLLWVVVFYLGTLTLEIVLVVRRQNALAEALDAGRQAPPAMTECSGQGR